MTRQGREVRSVRLLPLEHYEDYGDIPPEGMDLGDVELIWWTVASRMSKKELRKRLKRSQITILIRAASGMRQFQIFKGAVAILISAPSW